MSTSYESQYQHLLADVESQKQATGEAANVFPINQEGYFKLPLEERLDVARDVLNRYARIDRWEWRGEPVAAIIPMEESDGLELRASVSYQKGKTYAQDDKDEEPPEISVVVWGYDPQHDVSSQSHVKLDKLREGQYVDASGDVQEGWHVFIKGTYTGSVPNRTAELTSPRGQEITKFVDIAVGDLIEGRIKKERQLLGSQAVGAVDQSEAPAK
jgi:hypothetical protein